MTLLLLGGTFDPPHVGHLLLAECARHQFSAGRVAFLVAGDPWRKRDREVTPAGLRLEMVRIAIQGNAGFAVDDREVRRQGPTYTVDTLAELRAAGHDDLVLVLGSDALADLPNWHDPDRIRTLARLAVAPSAGGPPPRDGIEVVNMPPLSLSSTLIRDRVKARLPIRYLVPDAVAAFIAEHGLYR